MSNSNLKIFSLIPIVIVALFYVFYLVKWEPTILGVFKELLLLPSILAQFAFTFYFIFKILKKESRVTFPVLLNFIFSILIILSFNI